MKVVHVTFNYQTRFEVKGGRHKEDHLLFLLWKSALLS